MRGQMSGTVERIIIEAHQIEAFARTKRLLKLEKYLDPNKKSTKGGAGAVVQGMARMEKAGMKVKVRRIAPKEGKD